MNNIILVGFMGTGKSVVGHQLATKLQFSFLDTDDAIVRLAAKSIPEIFDQDGEAAFRALETKVLDRFVAEHKTRQVIATGGGIVLADHNWPLLKKLGRVICLSAQPEIILKRVGTGQGRPLLTGTHAEVGQRVKTMLEQRQSAYAKADWICETDKLTVHEVAEAIAINYVENPSRKGMDAKKC